MFAISPLPLPPVRVEVAIERLFSSERLPLDAANKSINYFLNKEHVRYLTSTPSSSLSGFRDNRGSQ